MDYRQKVPKALTTPLTMGGGSKKPVIFNGVLAMVGIFATGTFFYIIFFIINQISLLNFNYFIISNISFWMIWKPAPSFIRKITLNIIKRSKRMTI